jgi:MFS family permease
MPVFTLFSKSNPPFLMSTTPSSVLSAELASQERKAAISLAMIYAFRMFGLFMILPVFALYAEHLPGATPLLMGLALGIYGLTQALLQIPFGMWSDRIGRKPVIFIGLLIFAAGSLIAGTATNIEGIIVGRAIQGAGAIASALMALAADLSREEHRTKMMATIGASIGLAFGSSMMLGPYFDGLVGIQGIFYGTAVLAFIGIIILFTLVPTPAVSHFHRDAEVNAATLGDVLKNTQLLRLDFGIFALHFVLMCLFLVLPLELTDILQMDSAEHWKVYLPVLVASLVIMVPFIIIAEKKHKMKPVFNGAIAALLLATLWFAVITTETPHDALAYQFIGALVLFFASFNLLEASLPSLISKTSPATQKGTAMGVYSSSQFFGAFAGGAAGGWAHGHMGISGIFVVAFSVLVFWLVIALTMKKPENLSTYLLNVGDATIEQLLAVRGVVEATLVEGENDEGPVAYLKVKKNILDEENLLSLAVTARG